MAEKEYIEREEAYSLAKKVCEAVDSKPRVLLPRIILGLIDDLPAADVQPVVFCKDCVHFIRGELFGDMVCDYHYLHQYHAEPHEFCSHAAKREES